MLSLIKSVSHCLRKTLCLSVLPSHAFSVSVSVSHHLTLCLFVFLFSECHFVSPSHTLSLSVRSLHLSVGLVFSVSVYLSTSVCLTTCLSLFMSGWLCESNPPSSLWTVAVMLSSCDLCFRTY